jgi:hypothetical protein
MPRETSPSASDARALLRRRRSPGRECRLRRLHRGIHLCCIGQRQESGLRARGGVEHRAAGSATTGHARAADVVRNGLRCRRLRHAANRNAHGLHLVGNIARIARRGPTAPAPRPAEPGSRLPRKPEVGDRHAIPDLGSATPGPFRAHLAPVHRKQERCRLRLPFYAKPSALASSEMEGTRVRRGKHMAIARPEIAACARAIIKAIRITPFVEITRSCRRLICHRKRCNL